MKSPSYKCPNCGGSNLKRLELPHPIIHHWFVNPGLAFNEIVLGQRLPTTQLIFQDCDGPMLDRSYVPCPSCEAMHFGRLAGGKRGFGNWRGIGCPSCSEAIPSIWNVFSLVILALSFPLWALPYFLHFRKKPVRPFFQLENGQPPTPKRLTKKTWIFMGAGWGGAMWLIMSFLPAFTGGELPSWSAAFVGLPIWVLGGFAFGLFMWFFLGRAPNKKDQGKQGGGGQAATRSEST